MKKVEDKHESPKSSLGPWPGPWPALGLCVTDQTEGAACTAEGGITAVHTKTALTQQTRSQTLELLGRDFIGERLSGVPRLRRPVDRTSRRFLTGALFLREMENLRQSDT